MKRFLLFGGKHYYPMGGWRDFRRDGDSAEGLVPTREQEIDERLDWWEVVDAELGRVVIPVQECKE